MHQDHPRHRTRPAEPLEWLSATNDTADRPDPHGSRPSAAGTQPDGSVRQLVESAITTDFTCPANPHQTSDAQSLGAVPPRVKWRNRSRSPFGAGSSVGSGEVATALDYQPSSHPSPAGGVAAGGFNRPWPRTNPSRPSASLTVSRTFLRDFTCAAFRVVVELDSGRFRPSLLYRAAARHRTRRADHP